MADGLVLTRRVTERGVHEMAQRAGGAGGATVRQYVGYEEWATLTDVAMEAGYYDQSHLNRDFVALAGTTPGVVAADAGLAPEVRFVQDPERRPSA